MNRKGDTRMKPIGSSSTVTKARLVSIDIPSLVKPLALRSVRGEFDEVKAAKRKQFLASLGAPVMKTIEWSGPAQELKSNLTGLSKTMPELISGLTLTSCEGRIHLQENTLLYGRSHHCFETSCGEERREVRPDVLRDVGSKEDWKQVGQGSDKSSSLQEAAYRYSESEDYLWENAIRWKCPVHPEGCDMESMLEQEMKNHIAKYTDFNKGTLDGKIKMSQAKAEDSSVKSNKRNDGGSQKNLMVRSAPEEDTIKKDSETQTQEVNLIEKSVSQEDIIKKDSGTQTHEENLIDKIGQELGYMILKKNQHQDEVGDLLVCSHEVDGSVRGCIEHAIRDHGVEAIDIGDNASGGKWTVRIPMEVFENTQSYNSIIRYRGRFFMFSMITQRYSSCFWIYRFSNMKNVEGESRPYFKYYLYFGDQTESLSFKFTKNCVPLSKEFKDVLDENLCLTLPHQVVTQFVTEKSGVKHLTIRFKIYEGKATPETIYSENPTSSMESLVDESYDVTALMDNNDEN